MNSPEGQKSMEEFVNKIHKEENDRKTLIEKSWNIIKNKPDFYIEKAIERYSSEKYKKIYWDKNEEPLEKFYDILFNIAEKYGVELTAEEYEKKNNRFSSGSFILGKYLITLMQGQGSCVIVEKYTRTFEFIEPDNMKVLGFDCVSDKDGYYEYHNNATVHYNKDYNRQFPEPKGKVIINVNTKYDKKYVYLQIRQDGGTRNVYAGVCYTESFLKELLNNIR